MHEMKLPGLFLFLGLLCACSLYSTESSNPEPLISPAGKLVITSELAQAGFSLEKGHLYMTGGNIRFALSLQEEAPWVESYQIWNQSGEWEEVFRSPVRKGESCEHLVSWISGKRKKGFFAVHDVGLGILPNGHSFVRLSSEQEKLGLDKIIQMNPEEGLFLIKVNLKPRESLSFQSVESDYLFSPASPEDPPDFVWTPCLRPRAGDLIADHAFRSPALILQKNGLCGTLIPELDLLHAGQMGRNAMNLQGKHGEGPHLSYGFAAWRVRGHTYYEHNPEGYISMPGDGEGNYAFQLILLSDQSPAHGFRRVSRYLWERYGRPELMKTTREITERLEDFEKKTFEEEAFKLFTRVDLPAIQGGILRTERARWSNETTNQDAWFDARYQSIRTAMGMLVYSKLTGMDKIEYQAKSMVDLLLSTPVKEGIFPTIFCLSEDGKSGEWLLDSGWAGYKDCYHAFDCSWTGYWLLRFADHDKAYRRKIVPFLISYGNFLLEHQREDGSIPSFYNARTLEPRKDLLPFYQAETAGSALFLSELHAVVKEEKYLEGAIKAMSFISREVVPENRWCDFETFLSCSRKTFDFNDPFTGQRPQGTLCMMQAAWAYLSLFAQDRDEKWLSMGTRVLDYLSMQQQVWSPYFFSRPLFGGFGVQNTDCEWSDARGCYGADLFIRYYEITGNRYYFERGVAALHALIAVLPYSNWGHTGKDEPGSLGSIHWGMGSAAVTSLQMREKYGDAYIHGERQWGCALNACTLSDISRHGNRISFNLSSRLEWNSPAKVKFTGLKQGNYEIIVNGLDVGSRSSGLLRKGIEVPVSLRKD